MKKCQDPPDDNNNVFNRIHTIFHWNVKVRQLLKNIFAEHRLRALSPQKKKKSRQSPLLPLLPQFPTYSNPHHASPLLWQQTVVYRLSLRIEMSFFLSLWIVILLVFILVSYSLLVRAMFSFKEYREKEKKRPNGICLANNTQLISFVLFCLIGSMPTL